MRYVLARAQREAQTLAYRIYVTDSLFYRAQNKAFTERWYDLAKNEHNVEHDNRTAEEVISDLKNKLKDMGR